MAQPPRPPPRTSYVPGSAAQSGKSAKPGVPPKETFGKVGTQMVRAADVQRDAREEKRTAKQQAAGAAASKTPEPPPSVAARGIKRPGKAGSTGESPAASAPAAPRGDPFGSYGVRADTLTASPSGNSGSVLAIVAGLGFMIFSAAVLAVLVAFVGLWRAGYLTGEQGGPTVAVVEHIIDTGKVGGGPAAIDVNDPDYLKKMAARRAHQAKVEAAAPKGPDFSYIMLKIGDGTAFHSMEVNCPGGFRGRGSFSNAVARVDNVPTRETCTVTFQGAAGTGRTKMSGGQRRECTFKGTTVCNPY